MLCIVRMMRNEQTQFVNQLRSFFYDKPRATGLISHERDEKKSKFSVIKKKAEEKRPLE
jgi:hypothetical protein